MALPIWADGVFDSCMPTAASGSAQMDSNLKERWLACRTRFEQRWDMLRPDLWRVPEGQAPYEAFKNRWRYCNPSEQDARYTILYCAVRLDLDSSIGRLPPENIGPTVKELADINQKIAQGASELAALFRKRAKIKRDGFIDDRLGGPVGPDPFRLLEALCVATLNVPRLEFFGLLAKPSLEQLLRYARDVSHVEPEWPDLLDQVALCSARVASPVGGGDVAVFSSGTKATKWSRWALRLLGSLDDQTPYPPGFLRACLTYGQLATLLEAALDAPAGAYNEEQIGKLVRAYEKRMKAPQ